MGEATFAGYRFQIDPSSISWSFRTKAKDTPTVGGKVVQVFGSEMGDMTVEGQFGVAGWERQERFLREMKAYGTAQAQEGLKSNSTKPPVRFTYPPRKWDFMVYLKAYNNPDGGRSVTHRPELFSPKWRLVLFLVEDNADLRKVAMNAYIARLSKGLGWRQTEYNGGFGPSGEGLPSTFGGGGSGSSAGEGGFSLTGVSSNVTRWRDLVARHFPSGVVEQALRIIQCESEGDPNARNPQVTAYGNAHGLFQHMDKLWPERSQKAGVGGRSFYDPEANVIVAAMLYNERGNWSHWACASAATGG